MFPEIDQLLRSSFVGKSLKFNIGFKNAKEFEKKYFVFQIIASEFVVFNCVY